MELGFVIACLIIGAVAGLTGGLLGVGGGVVMVPAFIRFLGMNARDAVGTSIAVIIFIAVSATFKHHSNQATHWKIVALVTVSAIFASYFGASLANLASEKTLRLVFAAFLFVVATDMTIQAMRLPS